MRYAKRAGFAARPTAQGQPHRAVQHLCAAAAGPGKIPPPLPFCRAAAGQAVRCAANSKRKAGSNMHKKTRNAKKAAGQRLPYALACSAIFFLLGTFVVFSNLYSVAKNRKIEEGYAAVNARIVSRVNISTEYDYYKMRLYVEYKDPSGNTQTAWVQMPVSNHRYPEEFTTVYINPQKPGEPLYPQTARYIFVGWGFAAIFYVGGAAAFVYALFKKQG